MFAPGPIQLLLISIPILLIIGGILFVALQGRK